jgi:hypothetical protein
VSAIRATSTRSRELQAKNAAAKRWDKSDRDDIAREYATQRITDYIEKVLGEAPPLTDEQRTKLAELLKPARAAIKQGRLGELDASRANDGAA